MFDSHRDYDHIAGSVLIAVQCQIAEDDTSELRLTIMLVELDVTSWSSQGAPPYLSIVQAPILLLRDRPPCTVAFDQPAKPFAERTPSLSAGTPQHA
jgi:hypothetical protein